MPPARGKYALIVMGASAGGLQALTVLLEELPMDYPIPIVVVQHRTKDHRDLLEHVLQSRCTISIKQADEKEFIHPGHVYLAPPDYHLLVERDHTFSLTTGPLIQYSRPSIDALFESAAVAYGKQLVGILLTGANQDGAEGMGLIHHLGGLTIAQDPREAQYPTMPQAAIAAQAVHEVMPLPRIQHFLLAIGDRQMVEK